MPVNLDALLRYHTIDYCLQNQNLPNRRSIRLKGYDYSQEGLYFITICCEDRICRFGKVVNGKMVLNETGKIAEACWVQIPQHFPNVVLHEYVIMPNHIHGIIQIVGAKNFSPDTPHTPDTGTPEEKWAKDISPENKRAKDISPENKWQIDISPEEKRAKDFSPEEIRVKNFSPQSGTSKTVGSIVRGFKIGVTKWVRQNTEIQKLWQRNYYENIIRNEQAYQNISRYIQNNPLNWGKDKFYH